MRLKANRPVGFTLVSGICLLAHNLVMIAADALGSPLWGAVLFSYAVVLPLGYAGHSLLTFGEDMILARFGRYALAMVPNIPSAVALVWITKSVLGLPMYLAAPLATLCSLVLNYVLTHWAIMGYRVPTK